MCSCLTKCTRGTHPNNTRADGTFRQWCLESQSPGGGAKLDIGALDLAVLGLKTRAADGSHTAAATLRVNPPAGLPGVDALQYEGAVPMSKLTVLDDRFPVGTALFAHGELIPYDAEGSMTPAVAFSVTLHNPSPTVALHASLLLSLPLAAQPETDRVADAGAPRRPAPAATTAAACKAACDASAPCRAWSFTEAAATCALIDGGVPQNVYAAGVTSGIKGRWSAAAGGATLVHDRNVSHAPAAAAAPPPPSATDVTCTQRNWTAGVDIDRGTEIGTQVVAAGPAGLEQCRASCCGDPACTGWVVADATAPPGATPAPCAPGKPCCWRKAGPLTARPPCPFCTSGLRAAHPDPPAPASRPLDEQVGDFALHVPATLPGVTAAAYTAATLPDLFEAFAADATGAGGAVNADATHGV